MSHSPPETAAGRARFMLSRAFHKDPLLEEYCKALREARWAARVVGFLHAWSIFLSFCSLTWATVVLMGAFVSDLHFTDYSVVFALLLFEAARLACYTFFTEILTCSPDPGHLSHRRPLRAAHFLSPVFQALLITPSFIVAIIRLLNTPLYRHHCVDHLQISLRIFYVLIIANASVSSLNLFSSFMAWIRLRHHERSIHRYYDEVVQNVLANGVTQADTFNFFQYAFKMLGRDYANCNDWEIVVKGHQMLLRYIYAHKQGADYLQICLDSEDASVRQAAANMVGMWADEKRGVGLKTEELDLPPELLLKLADMVGTGEVGWAATNSFGALAKRDPQFIVQTLTSSKEPVLHRIAQLVNECSTRSLAFVRTLVLFYIQILLQRSGQPGQTAIEHRQILQAAGVENLRERMALPERIEAELVRKLKHLLEKSEVHRLRALAAYLLYLLGKLDAACHELIMVIVPSTDTYWYGMEKQMLDFLLENTACPSYPRIIPDQEDIYAGPIIYNTEAQREQSY